MRKRKLLSTIVLAFFILSPCVRAYSEPCIDEGENLGDLDGVRVYANGCAGENELSYWQCVEFAKRFYFQHCHFDVLYKWTGNGNQYHDMPGLVTFLNNVAVAEGSEPLALPKPGDTLSFGNALDPHVAIVSQVDTIGKTVTFFQQNVTVQGEQIVTDTIGYDIDPSTGVISLENGDYYPVNGWGRPRYSVPQFSLDGESFDAVHGIAGRILFGRMTAINPRDETYTVDFFGIGGLDEEGEVRDLEILADFELQPRSEREVVLSNTFAVAGDYTLYPFVDKDGQNLLETSPDNSVADRKIVFSILASERSVIVDDSQMDSSFFASDPLGIFIDPTGDWPDNTHRNYQPKGYLYGSIRVDSDSGSWAQWRPGVQGKYAVEVFIPSGGPNASVQYKIKPDGNETIVSRTVNQADYFDTWVGLEDETGGRLWDFTADGYVGLSADYAGGAYVGFDAVKFRHIFPDVDDSDPYRATLEAMFDLGVIDGHPDGTFKPDDPVNRAEFSKILVLAARRAGISLEPVSYEELCDRFGDMNIEDRDQAWYQEYMGSLVAADAMHGYPDGTENYVPGPLLPGKSISRAEMLKLIVEMFFPVVNTESCTQGVWFCRYVDKAREIGVRPVSDGSSFRSLSMDIMTSDLVGQDGLEIRATRAEAAKAIYDAFLLYNQGARGDGFEYSSRQG